MSQEDFSVTGLDPADSSPHKRRFSILGNAAMEMRGREGSEYG